MRNAYIDRLMGTFDTSNAMVVSTGLIITFGGLCIIGDATVKYAYYIFT